ncbi:hypothetical protein [Rhizorhabdus wittichii]|uniref:Uncharacterized protein n=1 Tax=Rhizorhabdus wittichii TaxID=160791 RepID=A0A975CXP7_9SPHN|nr:hypothetical protein [Rhizorhabdus wittichii]ARR53235.1 hypothetical protein HY78_07170 [Rhizorhabdus wittichii DC-6]QTH19700.1 hypothetical protein HRJ34_15110 [Rhizorhabdus wittichii]
MHEPSIRTSRLVIAAGLAAVILVGGAGFLLGRQTAPGPVPVAPPVVAPAPAPKPPVERLLHRAELVALAREAADAWSTGDALPDGLRRAAGQRFELVLPFGCSGPTGPDERLPMQWGYDDKQETLRISVTPVQWRAVDWGYDAGDARRAEGFWVARPWSSSDRCPERRPPSTPSGTEPITLPGQSLAVAQFLPADADGRIARNGRPLEVVRRVARADFDPSRGFRLRIAGRVDRDPEPVRCVQPGGTEQRPICVIKLRMDEIAIENAANDDILGRWPLANGR